ncbi:MAG: tRNA pseudouridine(55) synthase TruB [Acidobacteriota bacterium]|nr:tRNA pseudouridine(55) synthase TruB [Acidobacteriota bacterium]
MQLESFCFLPLNKPVGPTSHDMVDHIRKQAPKKLKVGHTGTLDPFASGVLIMALGKATRFAEEVHTLPKSYRATLRLGILTDTLDPTGEVEKKQKVPNFDAKRLRKLEQAFTGTLDQIPPVFSAKKVDGRKSYDLARDNQAVTLKPKQVTIHQLKLKKVDAETIHIDLTCSTGTYVRALGRDLAEALGTCGHLTTLERTAVGSVRVEDCVSPEELTPGNLARFAMPVSSLLSRFPDIPLPPDALPLLLQGRPFPITEMAPATFLGSFYDGQGVKAVFKCAFDPVASAIHSRMLCYLREE